MSIIGISEFSIQINKNDEIDKIENEIYNPSSGIITKLNQTKAQVDVLSDSVAIKADRDELITSKNEKFKVRYIRDYLNGSNVTSENRWIEVQAYSGSLNVLKGIVPSSNHTVINGDICTNEDISNGSYTVTQGSGTAYIQFDLSTVRDDIDFIHIWHYYSDNVIYDGTKTSISEDGINWVNLFDSKNNNSTGRYRETSRGSIVFVNQGAIIESVTRRISNAEILVRPESITQTVRDNMSKEFTSGINLLADKARFKKDIWSSSNFLFDDKHYFAMLNARDNASGSVSCTANVKLEKNSYYTFSFNVFQENALDTARFDMTITISGENLSETKDFLNFGLNQISSKQPKNFSFTIKTKNDDVSRSVSGISMTISRKNTISSVATIVFLEPQLETGAFPTAYTYPSSLEAEEFYSYKEQTAKLISQKVAEVSTISNLDNTSRWILKTPSVVTDSNHPIYALSEIPNPPVGGVFNSIRKSSTGEYKISNDSFSQNGSSWAIISAYMMYVRSENEEVKSKCIDVVNKIASLMINNVSTGRFNSMDFKFIDASYKFNKTTSEWEKGNYKEIYITSIWLNVNSLCKAYRMTGDERYARCAKDVLDSLYNAHAYINNKVTSKELPDFLQWASFEYLVCDNFSSSNRFSGSSRQYANQMGYYIDQSIKEFVDLFGDDTRTTSKGDKYRPTDIKNGFAKFLKTAYDKGITAKPLGLPYGYYHRVTLEDGSTDYVLQNWDFIDNAWGDTWFVGDVVLYTIIGYAALGFTDIAKEYTENYYKTRVPVSNDKWRERFNPYELVFFDRIDFNTGSHLSDDNSISITYTSLFYDLLEILGIQKYSDACAYTLHNRQIKSDNNVIDGGYPWNISKDDASLELKSFGEIINSKFYNVVNPSTIDTVNEKYSEIKQTANEISMKVSDVESAFNNQEYRNIIKNGSFDDKMSCWGVNNCTHHSVSKEERFTYDEYTLLVVSGGVNGGAFQRMEGFEVGAQYTCSFALLTDPDEPVTVTAWIEDADKNGVECYNTSNFEIFKFTFTATKANHTLVIYAKAEGRFYLDSVMMTKGTKYVPFEANQNEIRSELTEYKQTTKDFQFKIVKSGMNNLLKNSDFSVFEREKDEWGQDVTTISHWKKYGYALDQGMNTPCLDIIGYSHEWGYQSKTENTMQIRDKNNYATESGNAEMSAYTNVQTIAGKSYTLSFLCAGHRMSNAYTSIRDNNNNAHVFSRTIIDNLPTGGGDTNNWKHVTINFTAQSVNTRIEIGIYGVTSYDPYFWFTRPMLNTGQIALDYTTSNKELVSGITTIDADGVKIEMSDSNGAQGYTRINYEGLSTYDKNNNRKAWFGEDDSAYIKKLRCDDISNRHVLKWSEHRPYNYFIAPTATGDGTGRDQWNKSNSVNNTLNWIWNTYGCYSYQKNINIYMDAGTYYENIYIGGWLGSGSIMLEISADAIIYGSHIIEENTMHVYIKGRNDDAWSDYGAQFVYRPSYIDDLFCIRRSNVEIRGCRGVKEGYNWGWNDWGNYTNKFVNVGCGSQVFVFNCVACGFYYFGYASYTSILSLFKNRGHCRTAIAITSGSIGMLGHYHPIHYEKVECREASIYDERNLYNTHNANCHPKQEKPTPEIPDPPPPPPPPPPPSYIWVESTFNASNLRTFTEGSGSSTSNRTGMWGQGSWGGYKAHRGYADLGNDPSSWCSGGRNFTAWITLKRITSGGYNGEVPVPKIKEPNGNFWSCGQGFSHGQTRTIQLPGSIAGAIADGGIKTLEMWAGGSNTDYSFYDFTSIKIKCEKPT